MSLSTKEVIFNLALGYVGEYEVEDTATSRASKQYRLCNRYYDFARDYTLKRHNWNEANKRIIILEDATKPLFEFASRFAVPDDSLRIISISNRNGMGAPGYGDIFPWEVSGDYIFTNNAQKAKTWQSATDYVDGEFVSDSILAWVSGTVYLTDQVVTYGGTSYSAVLGHTASSSNRPDVDEATWTNRGTISSSVYECNTTHTSATSTRPRSQTTTTTWTSQGDDLNILYVTYVFQLTDVTSFTQILKNVIATQLASMIVTALHNDPKSKLALLNEIETLLLPQARSVDSMQGKPRELYSSRFVRSRWYGGPGKI